jgi:hypothetical protein
MAKGENEFEKNREGGWTLGNPDYNRFSQTNL